MSLKDRSFSPSFHSYWKTHYCQKKPRHFKHVKLTQLQKESEKIDPRKA